MSEGKRSGDGRVVHLYLELCTEIWGGSPAAKPGKGVETGGIIPCTPGTSHSAASTPSIINESMEESTNHHDVHDSNGDDGNTDGVAIETPRQRRALLDDQLKNQKANRMKRKLSADQQSAATAKEDVELRRMMLDKMEKMSQQHDSQIELLMGTGWCSQCPGSIFCKTVPTT